MFCKKCGKINFKSVRHMCGDTEYEVTGEGGEANGETVKIFAYAPYEAAQKYAEGIFDGHALGGYEGRVDITVCNPKSDYEETFHADIISVKSVEITPA